MQSCWDTLAIIDIGSLDMDIPQQNVTVQKSLQPGFDGHLFDVYQRLVIACQEAEGDPGRCQCRSGAESNPERAMNFKIHAQLIENQFTDCRLGEKQIDGHQAEPDCGQQRHNDKR